jgi:hypothetical protein
MVDFDFTGFEAALVLLDRGLSIKDIARHDSTRVFFSYHIMQCKKTLLKAIRDNPAKRARLVNYMIANSK